MSTTTVPTARPRPLYAVTTAWRGNGSIAHRLCVTEDEARRAWNWATDDAWTDQTKVEWTALTVESPNSWKGYKTLATMGSPKQPDLIAYWARVDDDMSSDVLVPAVSA